MRLYQFRTLICNFRKLFHQNKIINNLIITINIPKQCIIIFAQLLFCTSGGRREDEGHCAGVRHEDPQQVGDAQACRGRLQKATFG